MRILIIGAGISGYGAAKLALSQKFDVTIIDQFSSPSLIKTAQELTTLGAKAILECSQEKSTEIATAVDETIISPGINPNGLFAKALQLSPKVSSELEFGARYCKCPIWAITGTNGKTTTVEMSVHIMRHAGLNVKAAGNIGWPISLAALESDELDGLVVEVSSFQLEGIKDFTPQAAAVLNITSDHMDRYPNFTAYADTKLQLLAAAPSPQQRMAHISIAEMIPEPLQVETAGDEATCSLKKCGEKCIYNGMTLFTAYDLQVAGEHNFYNAMFAAWLATHANISASQIADALRLFKTGEHRLEKIYQSKLLTVYNDSKSTNPDSLIKALESTSQNNAKNVILLAGGRDKNMDFGKTVKLVKNYVKTAILIGETKTRLRELWETHTKCLVSENLARAVSLALEEAGPEDIVLLSPGCASQDMFADYRERGKIFCHEILRRLNNE